MLDTGPETRVVTPVDPAHVVGPSQIACVERAYSAAIDAEKTGDADALDDFVRRLPDVLDAKIRRLRGIGRRDLGDRNCRIGEARFIQQVGTKRVSFMQDEILTGMS